MSRSPNSSHPLRVLYHLPAPHSLSAGRTIAQGYKHAFLDLGHDFRFLTPSDDQRQLFAEFQPDLFLVGLGPLTFRYLDLDLLVQQKKRGMKVLVSLPFWRSPLAKTRINEVPSLADNREWVQLISSGRYGDLYYNICEPDDERMAGFTTTTGYPLQTVLLAADRTVIYPDFQPEFAAEIAFIGTYLPEKRVTFQEWVFPLARHYDLRLYGQDWTLWQRTLSFAHKVGQYFNLPYFRSLLKPPLAFADERRIYSSAKILINIHEQYQRRYGDLNERTFKILAAGGFELCDAVPTLNKYFSPGQHLVVAESSADWFEKIDYFLNHPAERQRIAAAGRQHVLAHHTYHHRVAQLLQFCRNI